MRALLHLTDSYLLDEEALIPSIEIAQNRNIPVKYLESILSELKLAHVVESKRGAYGGYRLATHPKYISVAQILRITDGSFGSRERSKT
ncbi:MAG: Rrf2 family transcriptional regulator [Actinomycetota bacterium]